MILQPTFEGIIERMLDAPQPEGMSGVKAMAAHLRNEFPHLTDKNALALSRALNRMADLYLKIDLEGGFK